MLQCRYRRMKQLQLSLGAKVAAFAVCDSAWPAPRGGGARGVTVLACALHCSDTTPGSSTRVAVAVDVEVEHAGAPHGGVVFAAAEACTRRARQREYF